MTNTDIVIIVLLIDAVIILVGARYIWLHVPAKST